MATEASALKVRIQDEMKAAMRAQDKARLAAIRLLLAAIKQREVDERIALSDADVLAVIDKMIKQRRESITQYQNAGRTDLVDKEAQEMTVLQSYLPAALSDAELDALIGAIIAETGASSIKDMGNVMNQLRPKIQGRCDIAEASNRVKAKLAGK